MQNLRRAYHDGIYAAERAWDASYRTGSQHTDTGRKNPYPLKEHPLRFLAYYLGRVRGSSPL